MSQKLEVRLKTQVVGVSAPLLAVLDHKWLISSLAPQN